jgi:hypothetical protein
LQEAALVILPTQQEQVTFNPLQQQLAHRSLQTVVMPLFVPFKVFVKTTHLSR